MTLKVTDNLYGDSRASFSLKLTAVRHILTNRSVMEAWIADIYPGLG